MTDTKHKLSFAFAYTHTSEMSKTLIAINCPRFGLRATMCILDELRGTCASSIMASELSITFTNAANNGLQQFSSHFGLHNFLSFAKHLTRP